MGWWFGRMMTFEIIADPEPATIAAILADASAGRIASDAVQTVGGYAAYGQSIAASVQPLVECFDVSLFDDGTALRPPLDRSAVAISSGELGNSVDGKKATRIERDRLPAVSVPSTMRLTYYDPDREYQGGEARASAGEQDIIEAQQELPAVLSASDAKSLAQQILARKWSARDTVTLRLPPARLGLEPGSIVEPGLAPASWVVDKATIDGFVTIVELRPSWQPTADLTGEPGRVLANKDLVEAPASLALFEAPDVAGAGTAGPTVLIAGSSSSAGWGVRPLTISSSGQSFLTQTAARKSVLGRAFTVLANARPELIDQSNSVDVELADAQQWLTSCDDDALGDGANLAFLGDELVQFGEATSLGSGRFRLARLLRGRYGTEWASDGHAIGEPFCLLDSSSLRLLPLPISMRGATVTVTDAKGSSTARSFGAESVKPLAPINLSAEVASNGDLVLGWIRRSRIAFAWVDEIDAPLGETREQYSVVISGVAASLERTAAEPSLVISASDLAALGSGTATIEVRQVGDWAASRAATLTIELS